MIFDIRHTTIYHFSQPVFLEPHILRLLPRGDNSQQVESLEIDIDPAPAGRFAGLDIEGNQFLRIWFEGLHTCLQVSATSRTRTLRMNPFDFLLETQNTRLPLVYSAELLYRLEPYLRRPKRSGDDAAGALASRIAGQVDRQVMPFLTELCRELYATVKIEHRAEGPPCSAHETLDARRGACRDAAVVFIETCRAVGLAARFVSGYQQGGPDADAELHAWAEVYLSEAGWRGFDPTLGLAVADRHVALAAGASPADAAPVSGSFRGNGAVSTLETSIELEMHGSLPAAVQTQVC